MLKIWDICVFLIYKKKKLNKKMKQIRGKNCQKQPTLCLVFVKKVKKVKKSKKKLKIFWKCCWHGLIGCDKIAKSLSERAEVDEYFDNCIVLNEYQIFSITK